jgi:regulator of sigma E protease
MSILIGILGLALLILVHELGHFTAALAVGLRPRRFYVGFPPAVWKTTRNGIEYGLGAIPLGGFVKIPGMHRPAPQDAELHLARAVHEQPEALAAPVERLRAALEEGDHDAARAALAEVRERGGRVRFSPAGEKSLKKGVEEIGDALGPEAYWRAPTWKRLVAIFAGPAANVLLAIVLFTILLLQDTYRVGIQLAADDDGAATTQVQRVVEDTPAAAAGLRAGDRIVAVDGEQVDAEALLERIRGSEGRELDFTVQRSGEDVQVSVAAESEGGRSPPAAVWRAVEIVGIVTKEIGASLGRLVTGEGRDEIASPVGIVQGSSTAVEQGVSQYLWVLGLISLSLALLNLLPLLPLDGGHIAFSLVEGARGRSVRREIYERVSAVGLAVVLLLFVIGLSNDIGRLGDG